MIEMLRWIADVSRGFVIACLAICLILDLAPNLNVTIMPVLNVTLQYALALLHSFLSLSLFKPFRHLHLILILSLSLFKPFLITHTMLVAGR